MFRSAQLCVVCMIAFIVQSCGDPQENRFVSLCVEAGDSNERCSCTFAMLEEEVGEMDDQYVSFVADFAKWDLAQGGQGLNREQIKDKYTLSEEQFRSRAQIVGSTMIRAFNICGTVPEHGPLDGPQT